MTDPCPPRSGSFANELHLFEHLCDHVLTRPEAHDWKLVMPDPHPVDVADDKALRSIATDLFTNGPSDGGTQLLRSYRIAILQAIDDALRLGWWWEERQGNYQEWCGLGLDGVFVAWNAQVIMTGYLAPSLSTYRPPSPEPPRSVNPLPRRDPARPLRRPPPESTRSRYELFGSSHWVVSNRFLGAYYNKEKKVRNWGSDIFFVPQNAPRIGKWQKWLAERAGNLRDCEVSS